MSWTVADLQDHVRFSAIFEEYDKIGEGADGIVTAYTHRHTAEVIAVKTPRYDCSSVNQVDQIMHEIRNLTILGNHSNISGMLTFAEHFGLKQGLAIFFQLADHGDLDHYVFNRLCHEKQHGRSVRVPESTILKLLRDVGLGLDYLHSGLSTSYVHIDLKPANILVLKPQGFTGAHDAIPLLPTFKITDFARLTPYPLPPAKSLSSWPGTYLYAPPLAERTRQGFSPAVDMWSFGATIQHIALQIKPRQSRAAFMAARMLQGLNYPRSEDEWQNQAWRNVIPTIYRPLDLTAAELRKHWDVKDKLSHHEPYSAKLNIWYKALMDQDPKKRLTAGQLKKYLIPLIDQHLAIEERMVLAKERFAEAKRLRDGVVGRREMYEGRQDAWMGEGVRRPSYEGGEYPAKH